MSQHPLPPAKHQGYLMIPSAQPIHQKKGKTPETRFNSQQIASHCLGVRKQNLGLRQGDLESSLKEVKTRLHAATRKKGTSKDKTNLNPFAGQKVTISSKSVVSF